MIEAPDRIRVSTTDADVAAFENNTLRALVLYDTEDYTKGEELGRVNTGKVVTVYPISESKRGNVGVVIYDSTGKVKP